MTQEEKSLLLQDLCARLPYETMFYSNSNGDECLLSIDLEYCKINELYTIEQIKPYLRSISSMTDEEREEWTDLFNKQLIELEKYSDEDAEEIAPQMFAMSHFSSINWLYSKHFNIILPKEAFIEVTEENNPYKEQSYDTRRKTYFRGFMCKTTIQTKVKNWKICF